MNHEWPTISSEHVWGPWMARTGPPKPTQYRICVHPDCKASETREAPRS